MVRDDFLPVCVSNNAKSWQNSPAIHRRLGVDLYICPKDDNAGVVLGRYISVKAAASRFGYSGQYLRRLLRDGKLDGVKIGQVWLIKLDSLKIHLKKVKLGLIGVLAPKGYLRIGLVCYDQ